MNDIIHSSNSFQFIMFADDTTLFTTLNSNEHYGIHNERLNNELEKISIWLKVNKLSLNVKKTKAMIFHMPQKKVQLPLLQIAESNIECVDNFNFLGITINKHLNWTSHVDALASKISKTIGVLSSLKHILSINILRTIYNSLIVCYLNYGVLVWGAQSNLNNKIVKLQKRAVRIITSSNYLAHSEPIFKKLYLLKLDDIYRIQLLKFIYKLINKQLPDYFNQNLLLYNTQRHQHATRACTNVFIPRVNHEFAKRNIRFSIAKIFNNSPDIIINKIFTHSIHGFSTYIKRYIIERYQNACTIINCYICRI